MARRAPALGQRFAFARVGSRGARRQSGNKDHKK